jgi:hypothetical protein
MAARCRSMCSRMCTSIGERCQPCCERVRGCWGAVQPRLLRCMACIRDALLWSAPYLLGLADLGALGYIQFHSGIPFLDGLDATWRCFSYKYPGKPRLPFFRGPCVAPLSFSLAGSVTWDLWLIGIVRAVAIMLACFLFDCTRDRKRGLTINSGEPPPGLF